MALVLFFVMGYGPMPAWSGQPGEDTITAAEIAAARMAAAQPDAASMDWAQATAGVLTEAPYPVYPGAKFASCMGTSGSGDDALEIVSIRTPDSGAKVAEFYKNRLPGWTKRDVLGGGIVFVTGNQAKAKGFARIIQGPAVLIEPHKSGPHPYTLITFQTRVHEK
jgi:hypothetical protein